MAYSSQDTDNNKKKGLAGWGQIHGRFQAIDKSLVAGATGYSDPGNWLNDKTFGCLGPAVLERLRQMAAALANGGAHYTLAGPFRNDKTYGHLGPDVLAVMNAMETEIAAKRP